MSRAPHSPTGRQKSEASYSASFFPCTPVFFRVQGKCFDEEKARELAKAIAQMTELLTQDDLTMDKKRRHVMKKNGKDECGLPFFL